MLKNIFKIVIPVILLINIPDDFYITAANKVKNSIPNTINMQQKEKEVMRLKIPSIDLNVSMYEYSSKLNEVDKGIQRLNELTPITNGGNMVLASHSGSADISYFKNLDKLQITDNINVEYNDILYTYVVEDIYTINKNINLNIDKNYYDTTITLITCDKFDKSKQLIVVGKLIV